ncbi:MAG: TetR/AcrR family transcriptional regulator [Myxococcales bacterium]|nr:TetR/AcrR family transcriptional regulator [Myxococcales bacterium]
MPSNRNHAPAGDPVKSDSARAGADEKRLRILEAARAVCGRLGYEAATMDAVAAEARVSKGTLYNHFDGKEDLFASTVLQEYDAGELRIAAHVGPGEDPVARLEGLLSAMVESFPAIAAGMMVNLQVWAVVSRDTEARRRMFEDLSARYARAGEALRATLRAGREAGRFRDDFDVDAVADGVAALFDGFVYRSVFDPENADGRAVAAAFDTLIRERVLRPATPETSR